MLPLLAVRYWEIYLLFLYLSILTNQYNSYNNNTNLTGEVMIIVLTM